MTAREAAGPQLPVNACRQALTFVVPTGRLAADGKAPIGGTQSFADSVGADHWPPAPGASGRGLNSGIAADQNSNQKVHPIF